MSPFDWFCRIRDEFAAFNYSWMRKLALGFLNNKKVIQSPYSAKTTQGLYQY